MIRPAENLLERMATVAIIASATTASEIVGNSGVEELLAVEVKFVDNVDDWDASVMMMENVPALASLLKSPP